MVDSSSLKVNGLSVNVKDSLVGSGVVEGVGSDSPRRRLANLKSNFLIGGPVEKL